jgi:endonuclease YncB( thermonuclease family)
MGGKPLKRLALLALCLSPFLCSHVALGAEAVDSCWTAVGRPLRVVDGDTFDAELKWEWHWHQTKVTIEAVERVRLFGFDTPEMTGDDRPRGEAALAFTQNWLARGPIDVTSCLRWGKNGRDAFGRSLAIVQRESEDLAELLDRAGHRK